MDYRRNRVTGGTFFLMVNRREYGSANTAYIDDTHFNPVETPPCRATGGLAAFVVCRRWIAGFIILQAERAAAPRHEKRESGDELRSSE